MRVEKLVAQLSESCETSGFFYLKIEEHFGEKCMQMLNAAKEVFKMPKDEKDKLVNDETSQMHHKGMEVQGDPDQNSLILRALIPNFRIRAI